ncbi:HlyD family efflux transporter periplasmic adaptor subunit [Marivita sp. GX14005]|uniref:HlyD family secretion protein n=1 Tax=Marivita sp. GX14005 TaxID=2942276 RepID=UPI002018D189|nr:HlyD family efflux transporter periplasmic adaptor subunit [Marivita sp. GX14005]MCL3882908.1 biotin/lipoyl-binding protein [Marivita sp. GX14005]
MKFLRPVVAAIIIIAALAAIGWYLWDRTNDGLPDGFATGNGRLEADQIDIATKSPGRVARILVNEGELVEAGDVLAIMDTRELEAQLARGKADAASAASQVDEVRALIEQRRAEVNMAEDDFGRASTLVDRGVNPQVLADQQMTRLKSAEAALHAAQASLTTAERRVEAANALVALYETQIADATLTAPVLGRILYRLAQPGEVLGGGGKIITLLDLSQVYMEIFLPADEALRTGLGAEARIRIDSIPYAIPAYVSFVSPEAQFTPKQVETAKEREKLMFRVKVRLPEELVEAYIEQVKTGVRGVAYIRLAGAGGTPWPAAFVGEPIPADALPDH